MKRLCATLFLLFMLFYFPFAYAVAEEEQVDLSALPKQLSEALGLPTDNDYFVGKILTSAIILSLFLIPTLFACTRFRKDVVIPSLFVGVTVLCFCVAMGWLPVFIIIILVLVIGGLMAGRLKEIFTG